MEARFGGKGSIYGPVVNEFNSVGKRPLEWDLNDWKWDGDHFLATPLNPSPSDCMSRQLFPLSPHITTNVTLSNSSSSSVEEINPSAEKWRREQEKRRRIDVFPEELHDGAGSLNLKLGEPVYRVVDGDDKVEMKSGKKSKVGGGSTGNHPVCQVEDCRADLSNAKDYHRRHKVCEMHSKATKALVGNVMQRFCQQCSRFHVLQEFDDGKRSCRRRLAGHNKRRRKTHPESSVDVGALTDEKNASYLLVTLLKVLSNLHANGSSQSNDQDLLMHVLRNLGGLVNGNNISEHMQGTHCLPNVETQIPEKGPANTHGQPLALPSNKPLMQERVPCPTTNYVPHKESAQAANVQRYTGCTFDLNDAYDESQDCIGGQEHGHASPSSIWAEQDLQKSSPPQNSGNSELTSNRSSSSGSEEQSCTDRIVFKLFGKSPNDLPHVLRSQILEWLSHSPTDIEGYIRPGCIVLTIYLRLNKCLWEEFYCDMSSSLSRLLNVSDDPFWKTGWIYTRVKQHAAFICDGRVILETPLPVRNRRNRILSISPLAVPASETVKLVVRGSNLALSTSRLLCAIEGSYLFQENCHVLEGADTVSTEQDEVQCLSFSCSIPDVNGRGFIEVEDNGLTGCFFPFIVAEPEICSEIRTLEKVIEAVSPNNFNDNDEECDTTELRNQALDFIHEMGWLLHRNQLRFKPNHNNPSSDLFPFGRLKWLIEFTVDHEWCAVLRKLLDLMFSGIVDAREYTSVEHALLEMSLLHEAVRKSSRPMIEFLLKYVPKKVNNTSDKDDRKLVDGSRGEFLFRPDMSGVGGLTPLHVAASIKGSEDVLDALLEDPGKVGIKAWKNARDTTGLTPYDYASLRGHHSYINLAEQKINKNTPSNHVVVDIPSPSSLKSNQNQISKLSSADVNSFYTEKSNNFQLGTSCRLCDFRFDYGSTRAALTFRPAVFSLVSIAAVCVCTALLFKSLPRVFGSFNWESLEYGTI